MGNARGWGAKVRSRSCVCRKFFPQSPAFLLQRLSNRRSQGGSVNDSGCPSQAAALRPGGRRITPLPCLHALRPMRGDASRTNRTGTLGQPDVVLAQNRCSASMAARVDFQQNQSLQRRRLQAVCGGGDDAVAVVGDPAAVPGYESIAGWRCRSDCGRELVEG